MDDAQRTDFLRALGDRVRGERARRGLSRKLLASLHIHQPLRHADGFAAVARGLPTPRA